MNVPLHSACVGLQQAEAGHSTSAAHEANAGCDTAVVLDQCFKEFLHSLAVLHWLMAVCSK